jgi:FkbM family methyltransferase
MITTLPNGQRAITHDTHLSKWAIERGSIITDPHLFAFLKPFMGSVATVWDIGANIGDHTRQYLDWEKKVLAVEPNPLAHECLCHNCPEAIIINAAASDDETGTLRFARLDNVGASRINPAGDIEVQPMLMDTMGTVMPPDFIKIDVEGWELHALRGMEKTVKQFRPMIFCEINRGALAENDTAPEDIVMWVRNTLGPHTQHFYPAKAKWSDPQFDILFIPQSGK